VNTAQIELGPKEHLARFLTEEPFFSSLGDFEGTLEVFSTQPVALMTVRSENNLISSVASMLPRNPGALTSGSVHSEHIAEAAVTSDKIAGNAVTNEKIADNSVGSGKIIDGSIGPQDLADGAVTQPKLAAAPPITGQVLEWNGTALQWKNRRPDGYVIVKGVATEFKPRATGEQMTIQVDCPEGRKVLGGGPHTRLGTFPPLSYTTDSYPSQDGTGWKVMLTAGENPIGSIEVRAVCVFSD